MGGGQTGSGLAFALRRAGIGKISVIDAADDETLSGILLTAARMNADTQIAGRTGTGRHRVELPGLVRSAARAGRLRCHRAIPRLLWAEYLSWYRHFLDIPVRYRTRLLRIEPAEGLFRLHLEIEGQPAIETTRKLVLATGFTGNGGPYIPPILAALPLTVLAHTKDQIDFAALRGKTVAVVGAAAAAFDAAGVALENGAAAVHLFARRPN